MLDCSLRFTLPLELLKRELLHLHPEVTHLSIDFSGERIQPIEYIDEYDLRFEYPPVIKWRTNGRKWHWSPRPAFERRYGSSGVYCVPVYNGFWESFLEVVRISLAPSDVIDQLIEEHNQKYPEVRHAVF